MNRGIISIILAFSVALICCKSAQEPEFIRISSVRPLLVNKDTVSLSCSVLYMNPNPISGKLIESEVDIYVNDVFVTKAKQEYDIEISSNDEFTLPLNLKVPIKSIIGEKQSILDNVIRTIMTRTFEIRYDGKAKVNLGGYKVSMPIQKKEVVKINI